MTVLKALKKMFGKSEAEQLAPGSSAPAHVQGSRNDGQQPGRTAPVASPKKEPVTTPATVNVAEEPAADQPRQEPRQEKPRRERAPKPVVIPWKLEDFAVEPQEGKTRFHDFKLAPELMHAIQDLGFPYCTPIQAQVLGFTLGTSAVGAYGNPLNPTPNLDKLATQSWFFKHFYVPVTGTAKTVWASITGVPDVTRQETATRNPLITRQHTLINAFEGYQKFYMIGGNAGWANINALIRQSIDGVQLFEESDWRSPRVDVWGISDLDLFKEGDALLRAVPKAQPFFAYLQTSGNHRPFTIPKHNDGFKVSNVTLAQAQAAGSRSVEQYNAVRLLDYNIGRLMEIAKAGGYYDNSIFVFFGDHNTRISQIPHMAPAFEQLGLESNNVPLLIHAPGLQPRVIEEAVGLADLLPTVAGMAGVPFRNGAMGRDIQQPAPEGERMVPLVLQEGTFPIIGGVTQDFLLQMQHDGSSPTLHDLASQTPREDVAAQHPEEFQRLQGLTRGLHETARLMLFRNVRE